jgi:hypothetical protein
MERQLLKPVITVKRHVWPTLYQLSAASHRLWAWQPAPTCIHDTKRAMALLLQLTIKYMGTPVPRALDRTSPVLAPSVRARGSDRDQVDASDDQDPVRAGKRSIQDAVLPCQPQTLPANGFRSESLGFGDSGEPGEPTQCRMLVAEPGDKHGSFAARIVVLQARAPERANGFWS